jgi:hypothetical protein
MRSSLFCDIMRRRLIIKDVSKQQIGPIFNGQALALGDGTDGLYRNVGN